jgi:hypothetical protein
VEQFIPPSSWRSLPRGFADEGVSIIELRPHGTYTLHGRVTGRSTGGYFRLRVEYFDQPEAQQGVGMHQDLSNDFTVLREPFGPNSVARARLHERPRR